MARNMQFDPMSGQLYLGPDAITPNELTTTVDRLLKVMTVGTIAELDVLINPELFVLVLDATGDPEVVSGSALYLGTYNDQDVRQWTKVLTGESIDLVISWAHILGAPNATPQEIDDNLTGKFEFITTTEAPTPETELQLVANTTYIVLAPCIGMLPADAPDKTWIKISVKPSGDGMEIQRGSATDSIEDSISTYATDSVFTQTFIYHASGHVWYII